MRRLGAILMILGVNIAVASVTAAFWLASWDCAMNAADAQCTQGAIVMFIKQMASAEGLVFWAFIIVGLLVFWRGKRMRASS